MAAILPLRREDGNWARNDTEKTATFAKHLQNVFTLHQIEGLAEHTSKIQDFLDAPLTTEEKLIKLTKNEITLAIGRLKLKKAPGYDLITGRILKELPETGITYLTHLYNSILRIYFKNPIFHVSF